MGDFSVVLFRPNFILVSEEYPVKVHKTDIEQVQNEKKPFTLG